jgi:Dolichyl-phosphate-mannose-protein mannosyltransferase
MTSPRSSRRQRAGSRIENSAAIGAGLCLVLLVPRILRMAYPQIWVEDDFYLESAYLVASGMRPYLDFVHPHMPVLEWIAAAYIKLFGASEASLELLNEAAIYATSLLVWALGRRVAGRRAGAAAAILYAFSSLVFRYHVYERECFVAPLALWAAILVLDDEAPEFRREALIAAIIVLACSIKLTGVIPGAVLLGFMALRDRHWIRAIETGLGITAGLLALSAFCYWLYGFQFLFQTFVFHFMKGHDSEAAIVLYPARILDIMAPLFVLGLIAVAIRGRPGRALVMVLAMVAADYAFFGVLSPTAWGHNYLEALPFIAIVAAIGALRMIDALRDLVTAASPAPSDWRWLIGGALLIVVGLAWATPLVNENWLRGSVYGFGFVPRAETDRLARALRDATGPSDEVIAPAFICFEANRRELIRYPETYGVLREAELEFKRDGFFAARRHLGSVDFFKLIIETSHFWTSRIKSAVTGRKVKAVISDSPIQLLPLVYVPEQALIDSGYRPALRTAHFTLWVLGPPRDSGAAP